MKKRKGRGNVSNTTLCKVASERAGIGPAIDVKAHDGRLYAVQKACEEHRGRLCVLDPSLKVLSCYEGVGNARQIEMVGSVAVISAREDGVFLFDVSEVEPRLLSHYRSVEYATGVALCGNLAFISCRQYGVEIIDVSNPSEPRFVALVRVGEVQSATVKDGYLYCGVWGEMKVVVVDVRIPAKARIVSQIPLQGRGDGVCVCNGRLYAATGQHARGILNVRDPNDPKFGMGNGVEVFDVTDPENPVRLGGRVFDKAYCMTVDMWEAAVYGELLMVNNSLLGVYGLDRDTLEILWRVLPPEDEKADAVTGATSLFGDLFFTTAFGDLFAVRGMGLASPPKNETEPRLDAAREELSVSGKGADAAVCYRGEFPVLAICRVENAVALALAEGGVHLLDAESLALLAAIPTADHADDVVYRNGSLYVAEGLAGVEIFRVEGAFVTRIGHIPTSRSIHQLSISRSGRYLLCGVGSTQLKLYDVSDPASPKEIASHTSRRGLFYGNNFAIEPLLDGTMAAFCHHDGLITINPDAGKIEFTNVEYIKKVGFCGYCAGGGIGAYGDKLLYTQRGGYVFVSDKHPNMTLIDDLPHYEVEPGFTGLFSFGDKVLVASLRVRGTVWVVDISEPEAPKILAKLRTNASPSKGVWVGKRLLVPAGRHGLLSIER